MKHKNFQKSKCKKIHTHMTKIFNNNLKNMNKNPNLTMPLTNFNK